MKYKEERKFIKKKLAVRGKKSERKEELFKKVEM